MKKCLSNKANHENLDLSRFGKNWSNQKKKNLFKNYSIYFFSTIYIYIYSHLSMCKQMINSKLNYLCLIGMLETV